MTYLRDETTAAYFAGQTFHSQAAPATQLFHYVAQRLEIVKSTVTEFHRFKNRTCQE